MNRLIKLGRGVLALSVLSTGTVAQTGPPREPTAAPSSEVGCPIATPTAAREINRRNVGFGGAAPFD